MQNIIRTRTLGMAIAMWAMTGLIGTSTGTLSARPIDDADRVFFQEGFDQFLLAPYFGPGLLPRELTLGINELMAGTKRVGAGSARAPSRSVRSMRVAAAQPVNRTIDFRLKPAEVLARVDRSLVDLEKLVHKAGAAGCDALALPEDTLGLLKWESANAEALDAVLPEAVKRMLERLGRAASKHGMYLVVCNDATEKDGRTYNTAFLLGRDGREIGRYHKVNLPLSEQGRARGETFPVFPTTDLGTVGMLICYDMVFPEAARCLALGGADVVFHPTLGGAAIGDDDISLAAFRTRAAENFVYLIVAMRGHGSMIISPRGKIIATADEPDGLAIADIDPFGGREGGDAFNTQADMRGRLFRERVPGAYGMLTRPDPPVLAKVRSNVTSDEAIRIMATVLTTGEERFNQAEALARAGKTEEAIRLFERLCEECRTSWIDRTARERLKRLRTPGAAPSPKAP
jgi:predicted amidohydrolase